MLDDIEEAKRLAKNLRKGRNKQNERARRVAEGFVRIESWVPATRVWEAREFLRSLCEVQ